MIGRIKLILIARKEDNIMKKHLWAGMGLLALAAGTVMLASRDPLTARQPVATNQKADEPVKEAAVERAADRAAIRKTLQDFGAAFQKGDAAAAVAFLTSGAELIPEEGQPVRGRDAIQKAFADHFAKKHPKA